MNTRSFLLSVLIAGVGIGVLGNLPVCNLINCALCVWVWAGGIAAVLLYRRFEGGEPSLSAGQAAGLGALSGLLGALVGAIVFSITASVSMPLFNDLARSLNVEGDLPFKAGDLGNMLGAAFIFLVVDAVLYPIFGALGAIIAASMTRQKQA